MQVGRGMMLKKVFLVQMFVVHGKNWKVYTMQYTIDPNSGNINSIFIYIRTSAELPVEAAADVGC